MCRGSFFLCLLGALPAVSGCGGGGSSSGDVTGEATGVEATGEASGVEETGEATGETTGVEETGAEETGEETGGFACSPRETLTPSVQFMTDISKASGIQVGNYDPTPPLAVPINDHSRLAVADINGDGWDDFVAHSLFPNPQAGIPFEHLVFMNNGDGTFTDFSDASGLRDHQSGFMIFGDVDNDGDQDVFSASDMVFIGSQDIFLNDGEGHFTLLPDAGFSDLGGGSMKAANGSFADFNGDGKLDLYVGYGHTGFSQPDRYYEGNGDGTFTDATSKLPGNPARRTNGTVTCDYDNDGDLDLFVSTYSVSAEGYGHNILWENDGGSFTNVALERGFAAQIGGNYWLGLADTPEDGKTLSNAIGSNGFGLDCKDVTNDGLMDVFITTISHPVSSDPFRKWSDPSQLLINQGPEADFSFVNEYLERGIPFNEGDVDGAIVDIDNDGRLDLSMSRDKKYEKAYADPDQKGWFGLMRQRADGMYESLGPGSGLNAMNAVTDASLTACATDAECTEEGEACFKEKCRRPCTSSEDCLAEQEICHSGGFCKLQLAMKNAQNHAWADFDRDGDMDLLVGGRDTGGGRPNFLFRNEFGTQNRWIAMRLEGDGESVNRDAIGARVSLVFADEVLLEEVRSSRGMHASADTRALHFGLGDRGCEYTMEVRWPDGVTASFQPGDFPEEAWLHLTYPDQLTVVSAP